VSPDTDAVVAGLKSEYFTSGLPQPVKNTLTLNSKMVAKRFMCGFGLTNQLRHSRPMTSDLPTEAFNGCCLERLVERSRFAAGHVGAVFSSRKQMVFS